MSFNRPSYDEGAYKKWIEQSTAPMNYHLGTPSNGDENCEGCYPHPPTIRLQYHGDSVIKGVPLVDVDSELLGLNRQLSKDPSTLYRPCCLDSMQRNGTTCTGGMPCGTGVTAECSSANTKPWQRPSDVNLKHFKDCMFNQEHTRLSNAPCNLRGTGWNRWEWLCINPQERVEIPFDWNVSSRTLAKDNHRPCIPTPLDQTPAMPLGGELPCPKLSGVCGNYIQPLY